MTAKFSFDLRGAPTPLPHFWEHTVGSGHAALALHADWRNQLERAHRELGFLHVRFHGILSDQIDVIRREGDRFLYSFHNVDQIFDFLLSIGMKPFVELSFMPTPLASGDKTVFEYHGNVTAPCDYDEWAKLIGALVSHCVDRYGVDEVKNWLFEVWNEPNLEDFGSGRLKDYVKLYAYTARAIKSINPNIRVGGPATANNAWISEFISACGKADAPIDMITTHQYPTDAFGKPGDDTVTQLSLSRRSVLREEARKVREEAGDFPVYYTEWASSSNSRDPMHDESYAAAFIVKTVLEANGLVQGYSYWTFTDIFDESYFDSRPFHGGFGLLTVNNVAKPAYRAYELLHGLGDTLFPVSGAHETVDAWASVRGSSAIIMLTNFGLPRHPIATQKVCVRVEGTATATSAAVRRIDDTHANPKQAWLKMGSPTYPDARVIAELETASKVTPEPVTLSRTHDAATFDIDLPPLSVAAVSIENAVKPNV